MALISRRKLKILYLKLVKQSGTPESVSRGVAIGFFTGFFIPFGGQMVIALGLAFLFKARKIPALACTWVTNPWTIPFIYPLQCYLGAKLLGRHLTLHVINNLIGTFLEEQTFESFVNMGEQIVIPFFVGGSFLGIIFAISSYFASYGMIISYAKRKEAKLAVRLAKLANRTSDNSHNIICNKDKIDK